MDPYSCLLGVRTIEPKEEPTFQGVINQLQLGFALSADRKRTASARPQA
jgi:hypothetical protein